MKVTLFSILTGIALLFVLGRPKGFKEKAERQEEQQIAEQTEKLNITFAVTNIEEEPVADIIWLKKAAEVSLEHGSPHFNVVNQMTTTRFVQKYNRNLSVIRGIIQLESDPMAADYDAYEISELVLSDETL